MAKTGNIQPQLDMAEHREDADNTGIGYKRVIPFSVLPDGSFELSVSKNLKFLWDNTTTADTTYLGWAKSGTATSAAGWRIKKVDTSAKSILQADGDSSFDNKWDDRATTVVYS